MLKEFSETKNYRPQTAHFISKSIFYRDQQGGPIRFEHYQGQGRCER